MGTRLFAGAGPWQSGFVTLDEKQRQMAGELAPLPDAPARLAWLIERARLRPMLPAELRLDRHLVEGCLSKLWFVTEYRDGRCWFRCESDSLVVKSVAGLLCDFYSGHTPAEIVKHPPAFLGAVGLPHYLTPNRRSTMGRFGRSPKRMPRHLSAAFVELVVCPRKDRGPQIGKGRRIGTEELRISNSIGQGQGPPPIRSL